MAVIKWNPLSEFTSKILEPPKPARSYQPEWYKKYKAFIGDDPKFNLSGEPNTTIKHCVPFADAMNAGYILESWQDIRIEVAEDGAVSYFARSMPDIIGHREHTSMDMGEDYHPIEFLLHPTWAPELPKGWSMLYTQPMNRPELPFYFPGGIVDSDKFTHNAEISNLPFYIKKSFSGTIPAGTPMVQMIPIKRSNWTSSKQKYDWIKQFKIVAEIRKSFWGGYKKSFWSKKYYK